MTTLADPHLSPGAREVARRVLQRVTGDRAYTSLVLHAELSAAGLSDRERRLATELCYGVCRHLTRLDRALSSASDRGRVSTRPAIRAILRIAAYQILFLDRVPAHAAVDEAVAAAGELAGKRVAGFVNSVLRRLAREGEPALPPERKARRYVRVAHSMPAWITERLALEHDTGPELISAAAAFNDRPALAIRVNRRRIEPDELSQVLGQENPRCQVERSAWCPDGLLLTGMGDPERSPSFARGLWTVQDIGAQLVTRFIGDLAPPSGRRLRILCACAGVGGKATHVAERFGDRAGIDAADISAHRLDACANTARRLGVEASVRMVVADSSRPHAGPPHTDPLAHDYDAVLLDAPCTGLGVMRRHPEARWRVVESDVARMAETQRALLEQVSTRVRPGGLLIYSVCTFTREEGPHQVSEFVDRHPAFAVEPPEISPPGHPDAILWDQLSSTPGENTGILSIWPHRHQADAFFAARLRRR